MTAWLRRHPLAVFLPLQALLGFWHLGLMSPWMDEAGTLMAMRRGLADVLAFAAQDVHPPLFYLVLYGWQHIPLPLDWAVQARALAVIFGLLATVALDHLWARFLPDRLRWWLVGLWSLSPCLLLYGRMCRSYSLQVLLVCVAGAYLRRLAIATELRNGIVFTLALVALLYTHYVPGLAMLAAANMVLAYRRQWTPLAAVDAAVIGAYAPWIWRLATSIGAWGGHGAGYTLTGNAWLELPVKLGYWAMSFTMGEAVPDLLLVAGAAALAIAVWLMRAGAREYPRTAALAAILTAVGFIGVARWVSYPFVPARMLFVLPFFLLLVVAGAGVHRRAGNFVLGAMLVLSITGAWCYFHKTSFRNKEYPMPLREIAGFLREKSSAQDSVIVIDSANSDPVAMQYWLGPERPFVWTTRPGSERELDARMADHRVRTVWFLRNTHDVSQGGVNARFEERLRANMRSTIYYYQPYSLLERGLMGVAGMRERPWYFQELIEFRR